MNFIINFTRTDKIKSVFERVFGGPWPI